MTLKIEIWFLLPPWGGKQLKDHEKSNFICTQLYKNVYYEIIWYIKVIVGHKNKLKKNSIVIITTNKKENNKDIMFAINYNCRWRLKLYIEEEYTLTNKKNDIKNL